MRVLVVLFAHRRGRRRRGRSTFEKKTRAAVDDCFPTAPLV
jgi:hypothetical protein